MDEVQVIAEPRRREILRLVWDRERPATEIAAHFEVTFGAVSQHLGVLRKAGLVEVRRDGTRRWYRANRAALAPYAAMLERMWSGHLDRLAELAEAAEAAEPAEPAGPVGLAGSTGAVAHDGEEDR
jgi:DNA-binding transcriptional ArsR family regulator